MDRLASSARYLRSHAAWLRLKCGSKASSTFWGTAAWQAHAANDNWSEASGTVKGCRLRFQEALHDIQVGSSAPEHFSRGHATQASANNISEAECSSAPAAGVIETLSNTVPVLVGSCRACIGSLATGKPSVRVYVRTGQEMVLPVACVHHAC